MSLKGHYKASSDTDRTMNVLVVRYGTRYFALPSDGVRGVLTGEEAGSGQTVVRIGRRYRGIDLARLLSTTLDEGSVDLRTVLFANGDSCGAIRVDEVIGLVDADRDQCRPLPPHFQREERTWIVGMILFQDKLALILNPEWVLGELGEVVAAAPGAPTAGVIAGSAGSGQPC